MLRERDFDVAGGSRAGQHRIADLADASSSVDVATCGWKLSDSPDRRASWNAGKPGQPEEPGQLISTQAEDICGNDGRDLPRYVVDVTQIPDNVERVRA